MIRSSVRKGLGMHAFFVRCQAKCAGEAVILAESQTRKGLDARTVHREEEEHDHPWRAEPKTTWSEPSWSPRPAESRPAESRSSPESTMPLFVPLWSVLASTSTERWLSDTLLRLRVAMVMQKIKISERGGGDCVAGTAALGHDV